MKKTKKGRWGIFLLVMLLLMGCATAQQKKDVNECYLVAAEQCNHLKSWSARSRCSKIKYVECLREKGYE